MQMITYTPETKVLANFLRQEPRLLGVSLDDEDGQVIIWAIASIPAFDGTNEAPGIVFFKGKTECMAINKVKEYRDRLVHPDSVDLDALQAPREEVEETTEETPDVYAWYDPEDPALLPIAA